MCQAIPSFFHFFARMQLDFCEEDERNPAYTKGGSERNYLIISDKQFSTATSFSLISPSFIIQNSSI